MIQLPVLLLYLIIHLLNHCHVVKVLREMHCHLETEHYFAHYAEVMLCLLFMLLMPNPDTDIIPLPFFTWFYHHLTGSRGLKVVAFFFSLLEVRQKLSLIPDKITPHQKNFCINQTVWATVSKVWCWWGLYLWGCGVRSGVVLTKLSLLTVEVSQNVINRAGSDN